MATLYFKSGSEMNFFRLSFILLGTCLSQSTFAAFGSQKVVENASVNSIQQGSSTTFVTFSGVAMPECAGSGGYLQPTWADANGGVVNDAATGRMLSIILSAKAMGTKMQVVYRVNDVGTGWNKCTITSVHSY